MPLWLLPYFVIYLFILIIFVCMWGGIVCMYMSIHHMCQSTLWKPEKGISPPFGFIVVISFISALIFIISFYKVWA